MGSLSGLLQEAIVNSFIRQRIPHAQETHRDDTLITRRSLGLETGSEDDDVPLVEERSFLPHVVWPAHCTTPVLKAGWFFSLITYVLLMLTQFVR